MEPGLGTHRVPAGGRPPVPEFTVVDHIPARLGVEQWDYPKAGDPNPLVKLGVLPAVGGPVQWVDLTKYSATDFLIVNVGWMPDSRRVVYQVQNREQSWLDVNIVPASGENPTTLFRETTKAWVDVNGPVRWRPCSLQPRTDTLRATRPPWSNRPVAKSTR